MKHQVIGRVIKSGLILLVSVLSVSAYSAPHGDILFARHCSACHGSAGMGGVGVPIALPSFIDSVSNRYLQKTIRHGRPGRIMPAFIMLSDAQVDSIIKYMRLWTGKPAPNEDDTKVVGNSKHGKVLFAKHCVRCHGKDGQGGKGTGVTFSRKRDLPIMPPALNNAGFLAAASDSMIRDTITFGRKGTPMTSMLVAGLSREDINDLVAYIRAFTPSAEKLQQVLNASDKLSPIITMASPYGMKETIENIKQAITNQNFTLIRVDYLDHGLVKKGKNDTTKVVIHFCNFKFLFNALAIDPRVGMFLPCRITVTEKAGKVQLSTVNPKRLSRLFNNHELDEACSTMHDIYQSILEDATL